MNVIFIIHILLSYQTKNLNVFLQKHKLIYSSSEDSIAEALPTRSNLGGRCHVPRRTWMYLIHTGWIELDIYEKIDKGK